MVVTIRNITCADAEQFLLLTQTLAEETTFMMLEPGERPVTVAAQREYIAQLLLRDNQMIFVAEDTGKLVGYLGAFGGTYRRNRHQVHLAIGLLQAYTGQGLGKQLFAILETWAYAHAVHRLELTVMTHNARAIQLYTRLGFSIEGTKSHALLVSGTYIDEYCMAKLLT